MKHIDSDTVDTKIEQTLTLPRTDRHLIEALGDDSSLQAELFRAVSFRGRNVVGPRVPIEDTVSLLHPTARGYFEQLVFWVKGQTGGALSELSFTAQQLDSAGLPAKDSDQHRGLFRQLGALSRTGSKHSSHWKFTERGEQMGRYMGLL